MKHHYDVIVLTSDIEKGSQFISCLMEKNNEKAFTIYPGDKYIGYKRTYKLVPDYKELINYTYYEAFIDSSVNFEEVTEHIHKYCLSNTGERPSNYIQQF